MENELTALAKMLPGHLVIEKRLWVKNVYVDIEHIDNNLSKPLDYLSAFKKMTKKLSSPTPQRPNT